MFWILVENDVFNFVHKIMAEVHTKLSGRHTHNGLFYEIIHVMCNKIKCFSTQICENPPYDFCKD